MTADSTQETGQLSLEDRYAIQELVVRYGYFLDDRDFEGFREIFTTDAVIAFDPDNPLEGLDRIIEQFRDVEIHPYQHMLVNHLIERVSDDEATVRSKAIYPITGNRTIEAIYRDVVVRTDAGWRIKHKSAGRYAVDVDDQQWKQEVDAARKKARSQTR